MVPESKPFHLHVNPEAIRTSSAINAIAKNSQKIPENLENSFELAKAAPSNEMIIFNPNHEILSEEYVTFQEIERYLGVYKGIDDRKQVPMTKNLFYAVEADTGSSLNNHAFLVGINKMYRTISIDWQNLEAVDNPKTEAAKLARIENEKIAKNDQDEEAKERLKVLDILGVSAGMKAHSERTAYQSGLMAALYLIVANPDAKLPETDTLEGMLYTHKFSRDERKIIALAFMSGEFHDIAKGMLNSDGLGKYAEILLTIRKRTEDEIKLMSEHPSDGAKLIHDASLHPIIETVARDHHSKDFKPFIEPEHKDKQEQFKQLINFILHDKSGLFFLILVVLNDQVEAGVSIRTYKKEQKILEMHSDDRIHFQQIAHDNLHLFIAYHQMLPILDKIAGNKLEELKEIALESA